MKRTFLHVEPILSIYLFPLLVLEMDAEVDINRNSCSMTSTYKSRERKSFNLTPFSPLSGRKVSTDALQHNLNTIVTGTDVHPAKKGDQFFSEDVEQKPFNAVCFWIKY